MLQAHAINSTVGKARTMIATLDERFEGRYDEIRSKMIQMFDLKTTEEVLSDFRNFKQGNNEKARDFYLRYQMRVNELLAKGIWTEEHMTPTLLIQHFRQRVRMDLDTKVSDHIEDTGVNLEGMDLDGFFEIVQRVEKRANRDQQRMSSIVAAPLVREQQRMQNNSRRCHYCGMTA